MKNSEADWRSALGAMLPADFVPEPEPPQPAKPAKRGTVTVRRERRRAGKIATIIAGIEDADLLATTAAALKKQLAVGGAADCGEILLQGDCRERAASALTALGFKVRGDLPK